MKRYVSPDICLEKFNTFEPVSTLADWLDTNGMEFQEASIVSYEIVSY